MHSFSHPFCFSLSTRGFQGKYPHVSVAALGISDPTSRQAPESLNGAADNQCYPCQLRGGFEGDCGLLVPKSVHSCKTESDLLGVGDNILFKRRKTLEDTLGILGDVLL